MSFKQMGIRSTRRKAALSSERKARKPFWKGWLYVLIWPTRKICRRRSEFSPWVKLCVKWENEKGKGVNSRTNKKANDEWHTCTQVPRLHGTTGLNKGFEKASLKWIKSMSDLCKARVSQLVYTYIYSWPSGLAVTICDNRAARRWRRKFKSGCTPICLYVFSADLQRLFLLLL